MVLLKQWWWSFQSWIVDQFWSIHHPMVGWYSWVYTGNTGKKIHNFSMAVRHASLRKWMYRILLWFKSVNFMEVPSSGTLFTVIKYLDGKLLILLTYLICCNKKIPRKQWPNAKKVEDNEYCIKPKIRNTNQEIIIRPLLLYLYYYTCISMNCSTTLLLTTVNFTKSVCKFFLTNSVFVQYDIYMYLR